MRKIILIGLAALTACESPAPQSAPESFFKGLTALCGKSLSGAVISTDPQDADWRSERLTAGPVDCQSAKTIIPLAVGDDKSRVWTISKMEDGRLHLSHAHKLKDGSPDPVTGYGGYSAAPGTAHRQDFPVDAHSISVFKANGLEASVTNIWSLEHIDGKLFAYELNRKGRHFRAEFPLQ